MMGVNQIQHIKRNIELHVKVLKMNDPSYRESADRILELLQTSADPMSRDRPEGHITCSGFVVNKDCEKALLVHHTRLQRWLQPGGHMEPDEYPAEAAAREVLEETGLERISIWPPGLIDIDIHKIPENAARKEPAHLHFDLRYLFIAEDDALSPNPDEISQAVWLPFDKILNDASMPESIQRMARHAKEHL